MPVWYVHVKARGKSPLKTWIYLVCAHAFILWHVCGGGGFFLMPCMFWGTKFKLSGLLPSTLLRHLISPLPHTPCFETEFLTSLGLTSYSRLEVHPVPGSPSLPLQGWEYRSMSLPLAFGVLFLFICLMWELETELRSLSGNYWLSYLPSLRESLTIFLSPINQSDAFATLPSLF